MIFTLLSLPMDGIKFIFNTIAKVAEEQYTDDAPLKEQLLALRRDSRSAIRKSDSDLRSSGTTQRLDANQNIAAGGQSVETVAQQVRKHLSQLAGSCLYLHVAVPRPMDVDVLQSDLGSQQVDRVLDQSRHGHLQRSA